LKLKFTLQLTLLQTTKAHTGIRTSYAYEVARTQGQKIAANILSILKFEKRLIGEKNAF